MSILIKTSSNSSNLQEWAIMEMQGDLAVRANEIIHSQYIGDLFYNKYGQPTLIIGHHIIQGREQKLDKPFAVLEKSVSDNDDMTAKHLDSSRMLDKTVNRTVLESTVAIENKSKQKTEYLVRAICTKKLIFKSRPKPIIANLPKKT